MLSDCGAGISCTYSFAFRFVMFFQIKGGKWRVEVFDVLWLLRFCNVVTWISLVCICKSYRGFLVGNKILHSMYARQKRYHILYYS